MPPVIKKIADEERGLILVTGQTGMGKSTTVESMLEYINANKRKHILTIEDPIEFLFKNDKSSFSQREIGTDVDSFSIALKSAFRQDPDLIFLG